MGCQNSKSHRRQDLTNQGSSEDMNDKKPKPFSFKDSNAFIKQRMVEIENEKKLKSQKSVNLEKLKTQKLSPSALHEIEKNSIIQDADKMDLKQLKNVIRKNKINTKLQEVENSTLLLRRSLSNLNTSSNSQNNNNGVSPTQNESNSDQNNQKEQSGVPSVRRSNFSQTMAPLQLHKKNSNTNNNTNQRKDQKKNGTSIMIQVGLQQEVYEFAPNNNDHTVLDHHSMMKQSQNQRKISCNSNVPHETACNNLEVQMNQSSLYNLKQKQNNDQRITVNVQ